MIKSTSVNKISIFLFIHTNCLIPQSQILPRLSSLFGVLLADRSWLRHQHTLEAFSHFAEVQQDLLIDIIC